MQECSGGKISEEVNIGVNLNAIVFYGISLMPELGRRLVGTLKAARCFGVLATSLFVSGCLQEKGVSGWEESIYDFSGSSVFGNLQQKPAVLWECMVAPWPCQVCIDTIWSPYADSFTESDGVAIVSPPKDFPQYNRCVLGPRRDIYGNQKIKMRIVIGPTTES